MTASQRDCQLGLLLVSAAAVAWSLSGLFTRYLAADTSTVLFWRGLFGAIGIIAVLWLWPSTGGLKAFQKLGKPGLAYAAVTSISMLLFISALRETTVAHVAVITATVPFFAAYLGWIVLREKPSRSQILASLVALIGVAVMSGAGMEGSPLGDLLALAMSLCMAAMIVISRRYCNIPALPAMCAASALTALATLPFAALVAVTAEDMTVLVIFALFNQVLGFGLFAIGARYLPPMQSALITALDAPLAPFWVWLAFFEVPTIATVIGGTLVVLAVVADILWAQRKPGIGI